MHIKLLVVFRKQKNRSRVIKIDLNKNKITFPVSVN